MANFRCPIGEVLRNKYSQPSVIILFILAIFYSDLFAGKNSAIITLGMPAGARQLGMGETGVALSEDPFATYWNPAALAFSPLADEWRLSHELPKDHIVRSITSRGRRGFLSQSEVWAGTNKGLIHFHNGTWKNYHTVTIEGDVKIHGLVRTFLGSDQGLDSIVATVKKFNQINTTEDEKFLVELRLPWAAVIKHPITSSFYEAKTDKLWIGTTQGLYRFDGKRWKFFNQEFTNPWITQIEAQGATIWIGTQDGLYRSRQGEIKRRGKVLPFQHVTSLNWNQKNKELFVGLKEGGVARLVPKAKKGEKDKWSLYNSEVDGLVDQTPLEITSDPEGHIWVAHATGLSHFTRKKWEQVLFDNNEITSVSSDSKGGIWIGTYKGIWHHQPKYLIQKVTIDTQEKRNQAGNTESAAQGSWYHYHTGHGLLGSKILEVEPQGSDIWLATSKGIEQFSKAKTQVAIFGESLLPKLNLPDLYHVMSAFTFPAEDWGTIGGNINFVSFGETSLGADSDATFNSTELVGTASYGTRLLTNTALGLNFKFIYSDLVSGVAGQEDATTASYAVDVGVIQRDVFIKGLNLGTVIANMGPNVFYVDKSQNDPIPLTWKFGVAYEVLNTPDYRILAMADYNKALIFENDDGSTAAFYEALYLGWTQPGGAGSENNSDGLKSFGQAQFNIGGEFTYANTLALRTGYLFDRPGTREELDIGVGVLISDILTLDFAMVSALGANKVRDSQTRFSLLFKF